MCCCNESVSPTVTPKPAPKPAPKPVQGSNTYSLALLGVPGETIKAKPKDILPEPADKKRTFWFWFVIIAIVVLLFTDWSE